LRNRSKLTAAVTHTAPNVISKKDYTPKAHLACGRTSLAAHRLV